MIPVLSTERLVLRGFEPRDFDAFADFWADADASAHVGGPADRFGAWTRLTSIVGHWTLRGYGLWALEEKATGDHIGYAGLWNPETWPEPEVGWVVYPRYQRRGFAREAAEAALDFAARTLGWSTAISLTLEKNTASRRLAESLGATLEGITRFRGVSAATYRHDPARFQS